MQELKVYFKGNYIGTLSYSSKNGLKATGDVSKLAKLVFATKGVIEDSVYLKILPDIVKKIPSITFKENFSNNRENTPQAFVNDVQLPDRRSF